MLLNILQQANNQRGSVLLIITMMVLTVMILLGSTYIYLSGSTRLGSTLYYERTQVYYIAGAGIEKALIGLKNNPNWQPNNPPVDFGQGRIESVTVSSLNNIYTIISIGKFQEAQKTLTVKANLAEVIIPTIPVGDNIYANNNYTINSAIIKNNIYVNGKFTIINNSTGSIIINNIYVNGDVTITNSDAGSIAVENIYATGIVNVSGNNINITTENSNQPAGALPSNQFKTAIISWQ